MEDIKNGGSAFPINQNNQYQQDGMTLRDYFAIHCLNGMMSNSNVADNLEQYVYRAYLCADAMLKAREANQ